MAGDILGTMARFFERGDFDAGALAGLTVAVVGYGNQGRAQALNARDSGLDVVVGARVGGVGFESARADGFDAVPIREAVGRADFVVLSLPDTVTGDVVREELSGVLREGQTVVFVHGFAWVYGLVELREEVDVVLVAPKGAGRKLRSEYLAGSGLAAFVAVARDATGSALDRALAYTDALGCFRRLVMETTFEEETHTDLFGEQAVLCGGIPELLKAAFDQLVEKGYSQEAAYFECIHEAKLITDLIYARGISGMRSSISETAAWGGLSVGPRVIGEEARAEMGACLDRIRSGEFAAEWIVEARDRRRMRHLAELEEGSGSEAPGRELRRRMGLEADE